MRIDTMSIKLTDKKMKEMLTYVNIKSIDIINFIKKTPGKNDKVEILKKAILTNENFKTSLIACYDSFYVYGIKNLDSIPRWKTPPMGTTERALSVFCNDFLIGKLAKKGSCDAPMKQHFSKALDRLGPEDLEMVKLIIARDMGAGFSVASINKAVPGLIFKYPVMLCQKFNEKTIKNIEYPAYAQVKMDGLRCNMFIQAGESDVQLRSRNGKYLQVHSVFNGIKSIMPKTGSYVIDGELLAHKVNDRFTYEDRKTSNGLASKALKGTIKPEDAARLVYVVWDVVSLANWRNGIEETPYEQRFENLKSRVMPGDSEYVKIRMVESIEVDDFQEASEYYHAQLEDGQEGIILKNKNSIWKDSRSNDQLKFKVESTADMRIVEVVAGKGKFRNKLGAFVVESECGIVTCSVGSGLNDAQREEYFHDDMIGKIVEMKYNEVIGNKTNKKKKSLFLPIFVKVRDDKDAANTLKELK